MRLWDVASGILKVAFTEHAWVDNVAFSPNGATLVSVNHDFFHGDNTIRLWDASSGDYLQTLAGHTGGVNSVAFSPDGLTLASGSEDGTVLLWSETRGRSETGEPVRASDVNRDGKVDNADLILVATFFGQSPSANRRADVNGDGTVDWRDLLLVIANLDESADAAASAIKSEFIGLDRDQIQAQIDLLLAMGDNSLAVQKTFAFLRHLLATIRPNETRLLPNYPNPFNPETWIPYQLAKPVDVTLRIYTSDGKLIRTLIIGTQPAGFYQQRNRAAYWDGKNAVGEPVASGVYFYTLTAGDFTATRKMLIRK